jgi:ribitol-5-phosphate 2-dehydrogenase
MLNRIYRLVDTKRIELVQREIITDRNTVLVKPEYMAICAADQRYYQGKRNKKIMLEKLPMALIHEAVGTVLFDISGEYKRGQKVALFPLINWENNDIKANYQEKSKFRSSGIDGFMSDIIAVNKENVIPVPGEDFYIYIFCELVSVALNAIANLPQNCNNFGVWGDGSMGYITLLTLKYLYPESCIYVFGKTLRKLQKFSFATKKIYIDKIPPNIKIDHCFECVGGKSSELAVNQMLDIITPQGSINLMGVSEVPILIDTRKVLEKGVKIFGNSRSNLNDFISAEKLIENNETMRKYLSLLISEIIEVKNENNIRNAFEQDILNDFKTVMKWNI